MNNRQLTSADKLFERLYNLRPCGDCKNDSCEECRWTTFAASRTDRNWDHYNYFDGGHEINPRPSTGGKGG